MTEFCDQRRPEEPYLVCDIAKGVEHRIHIEQHVGAWIDGSPVSWYRGDRDGKALYAPDRHDGSES